LKDRVWDVPIRLFHWALVLLVAFSWWTAETGRDQLHFWSGYAILFLLLFRILWGVFGSSTARFSSFVRGPGAVLTYVRNRFRWTVAGHTPLGALSVVAFLILLLLQVSTGLVSLDEDGLVGGPLSHLVSFDFSEAANGLHDQLFDILLVFIGLHIAAVLLYRVALGLDLVGPMITGKADLASGVEPMRPVPIPVALVCALAAAGLTAWIVAGAPPLGT